MIKQQYRDLVEDIIRHEYLAPVKTIEKNKNWVCYCGETHPAEELKGLVEYLISKDIDKIIMMTFYSVDDIKITILENITYQSLDDSYHNNAGESGIPWTNTILTTENIDFVCYKDEDNTCFSICGAEELVKQSFFGWDYNKMKEEFIKNAIGYDENDNLLTKEPKSYWMKFFKTYDELNGKNKKSTLNN